MAGTTMEKNKAYMQCRKALHHTSRRGAVACSHTLRKRGKESSQGIIYGAAKKYHWGNLPCTYSSKAKRLYGT